MPEGERARLYLVSDEAPPTDAQLVATFMRNEPGAPAEIWDRYYPLVRRILCRAVGPNQDEIGRAHV